MKNLTPGGERAILAAKRWVDIVREQLRAQHASPDRPDTIVLPDRPDTIVLPDFPDTIVLPDFDDDTLAGIIGAVGACHGVYEMDKARSRTTMTTPFPEFLQ